jgi:hypothetical protein
VKSYIPLIGLLISPVIWSQSSQVPSPPQSQPASQSPSKAVHFDASNSGGRWAVEADLVGAIEREGAALKIVIKNCILRRPERFNESEYVVSIRAGVSRSIGGGDSWGIQRRSERHLIEHDLKPGETLGIAPFELTIPTEGSEVQQGDWLTFEITTTSSRNGMAAGGFVYVQVHVELPRSYAIHNFTTNTGFVFFRGYADPAVHGIDVEMAGRIEPEADALKVIVTKCIVTPSDQQPLEGREVVSIVAGIARTTEVGRFRMERASESHPVGQAVKSNRIELPSFELRIPLDGFEMKPQDLLKFKIITKSVTPEEGTVAVYVSVPVELPSVQVVPVHQIPAAAEQRTPVTESRPIQPDPLPIVRELRSVIERDELGAAADLAAKLDAVVQAKQSAWLIRDAHERVDQVLTWLPAETESIWANQEPFTLQADESLDLMTSRPTLLQSLDRLCALDDGKYYRALSGRTIRLVIAGGRNMGGQGEVIGIPGPIAAQDVAYFYFFSEPVELPGHDELMEGHPVWRGVAKIDAGAPLQPRQKRPQREDENWMSLTRPDLLVLTNKRELLSEVLSRILHGSKIRALPPTLPEWNQVDRNAPFLGLRHYADQSKPKPGERGFKNAYLPYPDAAAVGTVVQIDTERQRLEILYLSQVRPAQRGTSDSLRREFQIDQPQAGVWRLVSDIGQRGPWPVHLALMMLGFGMYR